MAILTDIFDQQGIFVSLKKSQEARFGVYWV
jgi:hypothetical protein